MLPSLLARDVQNGLKQFLLHGFEPSDDFFHGLMQRFVDEESAWMKGPYLQIGLPFRVGAAGRKFFGHFETQYPGYVHQEAAWLRLASNQQAANTLVATGTGSGKTECFLYPLLDHASRTKAAGEQGVKALVIYPMNALASDQARRIADLVEMIPAFNGLRVGLFVGGQAGEPGSGTTMTAGGVITDRDTLRRAPPDILLTNYKMLDYLLIRPRDRKLWEKNAPTTLRYVVVDELHTFDGAQGTDLALLLRRLRARLQTPEGHLVCVGTSATLGGSTDTKPLRDYAEQVFGSTFPLDSVVTENRKSVADFLGDATIEHVLQWQEDSESLLNPTAYATQQAAVRAWYAVFFPGTPLPEDVEDSAWRMALGDMLKNHLLFVNLLKLAKDSAITLSDLQTQLQGPLPEVARRHIGRVLDALLVLVAWARSPETAAMPLVTMRIQIWMRELRRMVAKVAADPQQVELKASADLKSKPMGVYLPLVQCSQCHTTAWVSRLPSGRNKLSDKLDEIYNAWFGGSADVVRVYPGKLHASQSPVEGVPQLLCCSCGHMQGNGEVCSACGSEELVRVFRTTGVRNSQRGNMAYNWHDSTCPACGARDRLILLGARNATLGSQVIEHSWASPFNDDKKLIAFSDSVQDAAHRAGFFAARTYGNTVRTAMAKAVDVMARPSIAWPEFLERFGATWLEPGSPLEMLSKEDFVAEFIGPNMLWQRDWSDELLKKGTLPASSRLLRRVQKRLMWQAFSDFTYQSQRGRTLERVGKAVLAPETTQVLAVADTVLSVLREQFGAHGMERGLVIQWLWGFLSYLRQRGAVAHPELERFAEDGNIFGFAMARNEWLPSMGERTPRPSYLTLGTHQHFDKLVNARQQTWYERWMSACLGRQMLISTGMAEQIYREAIRCLVTAGLLREFDGGHLGRSVALAAERLQITSALARLESNDGKRYMHVPADMADALLGMPCLDALGFVYTSHGASGGWLASRFSAGDLRRVIAAEHTGLLERDEREALEVRFKSKTPHKWDENLLSATPTLEMGVDIGDLSAVMLCSVPPNQASFLQRIGRAGRRDGNALTTTLADGSSPHDLYFFEETEEMLAGEVAPPGIFLQAADVLRRQMMAFCLDDWVVSGIDDDALPEKTSSALDAIDKNASGRFPYTFLDHVLTNEPRLLGAFIQLLGKQASQRVQDRLKAFYTGTEELNGLRISMLKLLEELAFEREQHRRRANACKDKIKALKGKPQDEATKAEIDQLDRERQGALMLVKEINQRELLNTLTDAGLIPNYAFPEAGVELKSVLWRKKGSDDVGEGAYVALPAIKYERPAASAISEFAPENRFYANQRRVEVDQINMTLAKLEDWRLCPACHHMELLGAYGDDNAHTDVHANCPRCGDTMWSNISQRRPLLRFKQAIANSDDTRVRIDDSAEDREPKFYTRQLLADFDPTDVRHAWRIKTDSLPFGFEFIARANFRDINFGELGKPGENFKVADKESQRPGFKLCRHCGKVQQAPRRSDREEKKQDHAFDCEKRSAEDPASIIECLYLYREFSSEALRILVPYTQSGIDDEVVQSFIAALQLGLKKRFGGKVDHLRITMQDEPGREGGPRRQYVLLYDSVPGGTGYLEQLLSEDAQTLTDVLKMARDALHACACNVNPDKDGCYRCLYQYRLGRSMEMVSRRRAMEVLDELLSKLDQLEQVKSISDIYINPNFDSALEARFIESLKRLGGKGGIPHSKLVGEIIKGKSGYLLEIGGQSYWIEPQVEAVKADGIVWGSRPDFVIWPAQSKSARRPIAIFCDGWAYHNSILREDARKRSALLASGKFWVWSITHDDVKQALAGDTATDLESPLSRLTRNEGAAKLPDFLKPDAWAFQSNAVAQLLIWLSTPVEPDFDPGELKLRRNAVALTFRMVPPPKDPAHEVLKAELADLKTHWPVWMEVAGNAAAAGGKDGVAPTLRMWWPQSFAKSGASTDPSPGMVLLDDDAELPEKERQLVWRQWLQLFNHLQVLSGVLLATRRGIYGDDYLILPSPTGGASGEGSPADAQEHAWAAVLGAAMAITHAGLSVLKTSGAVPPDEIGFELQDEAGVVCAEAELAWSSGCVVLLLEHQAEYASQWQAAGWTVTEYHDGWAEQVQALLNNTKDKQ